MNLGDKRNEALLSFDAFEPLPYPKAAMQTKFPSRDMTQPYFSSLNFRALSGPPPFYYLSRGLGTPIPGNDSAQTTSFEYCSLLYALWKRVDAEWRGDVAWRKEPDSAA